MRRMRGATWRIAVLAASAYVAILVLTEAVILTTPYEVHPSWIVDRPINLAIDLVWIVALVVLVIRQPDNDLWKIVVVWAAAAAVLVIGYIPLEPTWVLETMRYVLGDLWAAVFIHLIVAYPTGRFQDRTDRRIVVTGYALAIGLKLVALAIAPQDCLAVCDLPVVLFPSETAWTVLQLGAIAIIAGLFTNRRSGSWSATGALPDRPGAGSSGRWSWPRRCGASWCSPATSPTRSSTRPPRTRPTRRTSSG